MTDRSQCKGRPSKPADTAWSGWALISPMTLINPFAAYVRKKNNPTFPFLCPSPFCCFTRPHVACGNGLQRGLPRQRDPFSKTPKNCRANFLNDLTPPRGAVGVTNPEIGHGADGWVWGQRGN